MLNKFNNLYNIILEGLRSGYPSGKLSENEIKFRLPLSIKYCEDILHKSLYVELTQHSLSPNKNHRFTFIKIYTCKNI